MLTYNQYLEIITRSRLSKLNYVLEGNVLHYLTKLFYGQLLENNTFAFKSKIYVLKMLYQL